MTMKTYDHLLLLKDAGAMTETGAGTVDGAERILDVGDAQFNGTLVVDTSAVDTSADETYTIALQGSTDLDFTTPVDLVSREITAAGRVEALFSNAVGDGTYYRYLRTYATVGGTTPSVNFTMFIGKA